jgi:hypothetical protein
MEVNHDNATPTEQDVAQPDATGTPPAKSAAETKLEGQLKEAKAKSDGYKKERDTARNELAKTSKERDTLRDENEQLKREKAEAAEAAEAAKSAQANAPTDEQPVAAQEPTQEEYIKDVLKRNGLKVAYMLTSGPCFSEAHAREFAGADFDSLTTISAE